MNIQDTYLKKQSGVALLEALIAIAIFSVGVLALIGLQARTVGLSADATYRSEAAFQANALIGQMQGDMTNVASYAYSGSGAAPAKLSDWVGELNTRLPGAATSPPTVTVGAQVTVLATWTRTVDIVIRWSPPGSQGAIHNYRVSTVISPNPPATAPDPLPPTVY